MSDEKQYVIVGAEVDQTERWLLPDGTIADQPAPGAIPLNVEFIGRLMVELSIRGKAQLSRQELDRAQEQVRAALMVQDFSALDGSAGLTDAERAAILERTTVRIEFESRRRYANSPDRNSRILVVPSDKTLEITQEMLERQGKAEGFRPPLSYELDKSLMLASLKSEILAMVREFAGKAPPDKWTPELQAALETHMAEAVAERSVFKDGGGLPADDVKNEIMTSPMRAFHRSVGIYATNMCR